jgi:single-strand DNA-binding protein
MPTAMRNKSKKTEQKEETTDTGRTVERKGPIAKVGNMTRTPELRFGSESGTAFCRFGLAVEAPKELGNWAGERETTFYEATCFGTLAEHVAELEKGTRVVVIGKGELEHWTDKDGTERTTKRILVDACGPDLRWASATVQRDKKQTRSTETPSVEGYGDEEPF